jgi:hypothetical protein
VSRNLVIGFLLLPIGVVLTPILPELGVPLILISTRFLQEKYEWARKLNVWVDAKYSSVKASIRKLRKK